MVTDIISHATMGAATLAAPYAENPDAIGSTLSRFCVVMSILCTCLKPYTIFLGYKRLSDTRGAGAGSYESMD